jgi:hypothetical protein
MRKERFSKQKRLKFMPRKDDPFQIIERINGNAYKVDLPGEYDFSATFNVSNLSLFYVGDDLRMNPFKQKENDVIQTTPRYLLKVEVGP